jgi:hypothetical protein
MYINFAQKYFLLKTVFIFKFSLQFVYNLNCLTTKNQQTKLLSEEDK